MTIMRVGVPDRGGRGCARPPRRGRRSDGVAPRGAGGAARRGVERLSGDEGVRGGRRELLARPAAAGLRGAGQAGEGGTGRGARGRPGGAPQQAAVPRHRRGAGRTGELRLHRGQALVPPGGPAGPGPGRRSSRHRRADRAAHRTVRVRRGQGRAVRGAVAHDARGCDEAEFLLRGARVGPYLTCRMGTDFERANRDWCRDVVEVLRARREVRAES